MNQSDDCLGTVTWDELHYHFLIDHKIMSPDDAKSHDESVHENMDDDREFSVIQHIE